MDGSFRGIDLTPTKGAVATLAVFVALTLIGAGTVIGWLYGLVA